MKIEEHPKLEHLNALLRRVDVGDRYISARLEMFSVEAKNVPSRSPLGRPEKRRASEISAGSGEKSLSPNSLAHSPPGMLMNLVSTMSQVYPDYDFEGLKPEHFDRCPDLNTVVNSINHNLAIVVERVSNGFIGDLWKAIRECIDLNQAEIYAFTGQSGGAFDDMPHRGSLWSFDYFFYDSGQRRIVIFSCVARSRRKGYDDDASDVPPDTPSEPNTPPEELDEGEYGFADDDTDSDSEKSNSPKKKRKASLRANAYGD